MTKRKIIGAAAGAFGALFAMQASAAHLSYVNTPTAEDFPNFCQGSISDCVYDPDVYGEEGDPTPAIIKFNFNNDGSVANFEVSSLFGSIDGSEFTFGTTQVDADGEEGGPTVTGYTFSYTPGEGDPFITAFAAKGGPSFTFYDGYGDEENDIRFATFITPFNTNGGNQPKTYGLSNLTFFDTSVAPIPLPAAGWMLLAGIGGLAAARRRKN